MTWTRIGSMYTFAVRATDNVGVVRVRVDVSGQRIEARLIGGLWQASARVDRRQYVVAHALDAAGNSTSYAITVLR